MALQIHRILIHLLIILLPLMSNLVEHSASTILSVYILMGIGAWLTRRHRMDLDTPQKAVMISFAAYFAVCLAFFLVRGLFHPQFSLEWDLGHEIRMLGFLPIYYLFLRYGLKADAFWIGVSGGAILSGIYACIYIYVLHAGQRATGAYHQIAFGDISIALGFMSLAGFRHFRKKRLVLTLIPVMAVSAGILAAYLSGTRGAIIAIPVLAIVFFVQLGATPYRRILRTSAVLILLCLTVAGYFIPGSSMKERICSGIEEAVAIFRGETDKPVVTAVRVLMWPQAIELIKQHPFTGVGKEGYRQFVRKNARTRKELEYITAFSTPHNMYLTHMAAYGILGLLSLLGLFLTPLLVFIRYVRENENCSDFAYAGIMLVVAFMNFAITESIFTRNIFIAVYVILTAAALALCQMYPSPQEAE